MGRRASGKGWRAGRVRRRCSGQGERVGRGEEGE